LDKKHLKLHPLGADFYLNKPTSVISPYFVDFIFWLKASGKGKGKAIPLQAWTGPEGSRRLSLPEFKTVVT
jgi:hypothetical protein